MNKRINTARMRRGLMVLAAGTLVSLGAAAWAEPGAMQGHMGMQGMEMGYGHHAFYPHNATAHFLKMAPHLDLTDAQIKQITKMRDDYIEKNAAAEDQLKAAYSDLKRVLYADDVDMGAVNTLFDKIDKLDAQLWRAFAQQLHDIKAMLTASQKQMLKDMHEEGPGEGMGMMHKGMKDMDMDMKGMDMKDMK